MLSAFGIEMWSRAVRLRTLIDDTNIIYESSAESLLTSARGVERDFFFKTKSDLARTREN